MYGKYTQMRKRLQETEAERRKSMKLGLFGGSFNPIHNGHIDMARRVKEQLALDGVLFMVAKEPPHKELAGDVDAVSRLAMAQAALAGENGLSASGLELSRPGKSYTVDTVRTLLAENPGAEISLIVGEDMLRNLPAWRGGNPSRACAGDRGFAARR